MPVFNHLNSSETGMAKNSHVSDLSFTFVTALASLCVVWVCFSHPVAQLPPSSPEEPVDSWLYSAISHLATYKQLKSWLVSVWTSLGWGALVAYSTYVNKAWCFL